MTDFSSMTYENILTQMLSDVPDTFDKRDTSPIPTALGPAAYVLEGFYIALQAVQNSAYIQTAQGENLDSLAIIGGLTRHQATPAVRLGVFNVSVPLGARFSTINGENSINFVVTEYTGTPYEYQLTAETPGAIGNDYAGPILPITAVQGLASASITSILLPGEDTETDAALRQRLIEALTVKPFAGNIASYKEYVNDMDGVGGVQVYPTWNGGGTVKISVLGADELPASQTLVDAVQDALDPASGNGAGLAPIGAEVTVVAPTAVTCNITATLTLSPGYTIDQVQSLVEDAIAAYLLEIRQEWDEPIDANSNTYSSTVYISRITAAIVGVVGVANATSVKVNSSSSDLALTESGVSQEVPVLGTVTLS